MVLEALAALSLASSVVQFVDFASKLISKGNKFYRSADGVLDENVELAAIGENLNRLTQGLMGSSKPFSSHAEQLTSEEVALQKIAAKCQEIALSFKTALDGLKIVGARTRWKSFRQALKCYWSKETIEEMLQMLRLIREDLAVHLLVVIHDQQATNKNLMINLNKRMEREILASVRESSNSLRHEIATLSDGLRQASEQRRSSLVNVWRVENTEQLSQLGLDMSKATNHEKKRKTGDLMLHSLYFPQMKDRYQKVAKAHIKTFNWIFDSVSDSPATWSNYVQWLRARDSQNNLYWVTGKAGSGKSTLMKYLCDHSLTREHLELWAEPDKLVFASCFFWNPGTEDQKSLIGLLRSLLHEILSQRMDLVQVASPWRWQAYELGVSTVSPWTTFELLDALRSILIKSKHATKFALYIDGLDEFEGDDRARSDIIDFLKEIASYEHNKVCVSSRPWLIFEDAFESGPLLRLEALTYNDITEYVHVELGGNTKFQKLSRSNAIACADLIRNVVDKAAGVFLWVYLVVHLLSEGLRNEDDVIDLQRRLDLMPSDLEEFFTRMIGTLDPFYLRQAARLFQIALRADEAQTLLTYSFTQERNPDFAVNAKVKLLSEDEGVERLTSMRRLLNSRCKGLLEVNDETAKSIFQTPTVHFLHRTARDFLQFSAKNTVLDPYLSEPYDVSIELCKSYLAQIKCMDLSPHDLTAFVQLFRGIMKRAFRLEFTDDQAHTRVLDELDKAIRISTGREEWSTSGIWTVAHRSAKSLTRARARKWTDDDSFLSLAIAAGLLEYVKYRIECDSSLLNRRSGRPLLDSALRPTWCESRELGRLLSIDEPKEDPRLIEVMLEKGGDLNEHYCGSTVWTLFLGYVEGRGTIHNAMDRDSDYLEEVTRLCLIDPALGENSLDEMLTSLTFASENRSSINSTLNGRMILERTFGDTKAQRLIMAFQEARRCPSTTEETQNPIQQSECMPLSNQAPDKPTDSQSRRNNMATTIARISSKCTKPFQMKKS